MIKLFASDLDGTLLNDQHQLDDVIVSAIQKVIHEKRIFVISTGRPMYKAHRDEFNSIAGSFYTVCMNGALVYDLDGKIIYKKSIDQQSVIQLMNEFPDLCFEFCTSEHVLIRSSKENHRTAFDEMNEDIDNIEEVIKYFTMYNIYDVSEKTIKQSEILKINCFVKNPKDQKKLNDYLSFHQDKLVNAPYEDGYYEITEASVNKASGIIELNRILKINEDEIAVYGDGLNDLEMLSYFKHSYATENAHDQAKQRAREVIGTCGQYAVPKHMLQTINKEKAGMSVKE